MYGTNDQGKNSFHSLNLHSGYRWQGFNMGAYYMNGGGQSEIPQIVAGLVTNTSSDNDALGFNVTHALPLRGSATLATIAPTGTPIIWATAPAEPSTSSTPSPQCIRSKTVALRQI